MNKAEKEHLFWYLRELLHLEKDIVVMATDNVIHLEVKGFPFYLYIKSLTYAGNPYPQNTTRAQLPRREEFDSIKNSNAVFLFLGYDEAEEVFACWDPIRTKARLNEKQYVSFFSRLNLQQLVKERGFVTAYLQNDFKYVLFHINSLPHFLLNIKDYFPDLNLSSNTIALSDKSEGVLLDVENDSSIKLLIDELYRNNEDISILSLISNCINEFGEYYDRMSLKDWNRIVSKYITYKRDATDSIEELYSSYSSDNIAAEP